LNKAGIDMGNSSASFLDLARLWGRLPMAYPQGRPDDARSQGRMAIAARDKKRVPAKQAYWQSAWVT
jgi:hypothetical protein